MTAEAPQGLSEARAADVGGLSVFRTRGLTFRYPREAGPVLSGLTVEIPQGQAVALMGVSGVGKSTVLYLMGLLWQGRLAGGEVFYRSARDGEVSLYGGLPAPRQEAYRREEFGFIFQDSALLPNLTCGENVALPLVVRGEEREKAEERVRDLLLRAAPSGELERLRGRFGGGVSGGQQARLAALRALVHDPRVVFADEPFAKLDDINRGRLLDLLRDWRAGDLGSATEERTLLLVCHDYRVAYERADHFIVLYRQRMAGLWCCRPKAEMSGPEDLRRLLDEEEAP